MSGVKDRACPKCREQGGDKTSNHLFMLSNGSGWYCNRCAYFEKVTEPSELTPLPEIKNVFKGPYSSPEVPLRRDYRGIPSFVAKQFNVLGECSPATGEIVKSYYPVKKKGEIVGHKIREHPKKFHTTGDCRGATELFGIGTISRNVIITGGEEDAMSAYYMLLATNKNDKYDVCVYSVVHGEQAVQDIVNNIDFLNTFEKVILCLDNDGKNKEKEMSAVLGAKAYTMRFSEKDANDMLLQGKQGEFVDSFWKAKQYKPEELLWASDVVDTVFVEEDANPIRYPFKGLDECLGGIRKGEMVTFCAGTGVGKTTMIHHIVTHLLHSTNWRIGTLCLEEAPRRTLKQLALVAGIHTAAELDLLIKDRVMMLDCFGSNSIQAIESTIRFMAATGMDMVLLDHVSMMVADAADDERRTLDKIMVKLRTLVQELNISMLVVAHLRRAQGDVGYEDGKIVSLSALRSSASIGQLSDAVIALERKVSDDDEFAKNEVNIRVLKNRYRGTTGSVGKLRYEEGKLKEVL